jgi:hypothetical protein
MKSKRTYTIAVRIRKHSKSRKSLPDFGLGPGVLSRQDVGFTDKRGWGWDHPTFIMSLLQVQEELVQHAVECVIERIK